MRPVVDVVDALLAGARINVTVYQGQLDLICLTAGTEQWMSRLTWPGYPAFAASDKVPLYPYPGSTATGAFVKGYGRLSFFAIMDVGHMVPSDNGQMALQMLQQVTGVAPWPL
jgi:serine carboxypeptidase 1